MTVQLVAGLALTCTLHVGHSVSSHHAAPVPDMIVSELRWITRQRRWFCGYYDAHIVNFSANTVTSCIELLSQRRTLS